MTLRVFAVFNEIGTPIGFYPGDVWPIPPEGAIEISIDDWREFLDYQGQRRWDGHQVVEYTPPPASDPSLPPPPEIADLVQENQAMNEAIVAAVRAWAGLENSLAYLLGTIITQGGGSLGMAIYYSPDSTETRLGIVNEAAVHFCASHPDGDPVKPLWIQLYKRIKKSKSTRNKIVHGNVVTHARRNGKNYIRLTAPIFNFTSKNKDMAHLIKQVEAMARGEISQLPGMSANDVMDAAANFSDLAQMVGDLRLVLSHMQRVVPQPEAFQKKIQTLETHLKT